MADPYIRRGQRQEGYVSRGGDPPGYRRASGIINARQNMDTIKGFSGLNSQRVLQDRRVPAFPRPGFKGQSAGEIGEYLTERNVALNRDGSFSPRDQIMGRDRSAMDRRSGQPPRRGQPAPQPNPAMGAAAQAAQAAQSAMGAMGGAASTAGSAVSNAAAKAAQNIGGGGASPRREFGGRGMQPRGEWQRPTPNPRGPMPTAADTAARAQEMRDERSMMNDMRNEVSRTRDSSGRVTDMSSKHGSGSVQFLDPKQQVSRPPGMTKDDFGRPQPIRQEINRMTENQATKGIGSQGEPIAPAGQGPAPGKGVGPQQVAPAGAAGAAAPGKGVVGGAVGGPGKPNTASGSGNGASLMETANEIINMKAPVKDKKKGAA